MRKTRNTAAISRPENRRKFDFYSTPMSATEALLDIVPEISGTVLEICSGGYHIAHVLKQHKIPIITNVLNANADADFHVDAAGENTEILLPEADWVITNPPFDEAPKIVANSFNKAKVGIAMLLRGSFTEPTYNRQDWLYEHAKHLKHIIFLPKISFTGDRKKDSVSCNWYVWTRQEVQGCQLHWIRK